MWTTKLSEKPTTMKPITTCSVLPTLLLTMLASVAVGQSLLAPIRVADMNPSGSSSPTELTVAGANKDQLYFVCNNGVGGGSTHRVWIYALNSASGALEQKAETPGYLHILAAGENRVFYSYQTYTSMDIPYVKWSGINGIADGSVFTGKFRYPEVGVTISDKLITAGDFPTANPYVGREPCVIESATSATMLRDVAPGSGNSNSGGFTLHNGRAYFVANNSASGTELYTTDGTPAGTLMMKDIITGATGSEPQDMRSVGGRLYFSALVAAGNREPWTCNGTTAGTVKLKEINPSTTVGSDPKEFTALGTKVFFSANNGTSGRELWVTDGTANGTVMVKDLIAGATGSDPHDLTVYNNKVWFVANDALAATRALWSSDGTAAGTIKVLSLPRGSDAENLNVCNGKLFYVSRDATTSKMWCTNGTTKGTKQVQPAVSPNINPIGTTRMAVMGNWLYFSGNFDGTGAELWKVQ